MGRMGGQNQFLYGSTECLLGGGEFDRGGVPTDGMGAMAGAGSEESGKRGEGGPVGGCYVTTICRGAGPGKDWPDDDKAGAYGWAERAEFWGGGARAVARIRADPWDGSGDEVMSIGVPIRRAVASRVKIQLFHTCSISPKAHR